MADGSGAVHRQGNVAGMLHARHVIRIPHDLFDLIAEPHIDRFIDQSARDQCQEHGWNERESDERRHQFGSKSRPKEPMPSLEVGLDEIAGEQQQQHHKPDQIEVEEQEHKRVARCGQKGIGFLAAGNHDLRIVQRQRQAGEQENQDNPDRP